MNQISNRAPSEGLFSFTSRIRMIWAAIIGLVVMMIPPK
jgi:hypothetical protein